MKYYPVFLNIRGRLCVVLGGGEIAARKVCALVDAGASVTVVSLRFGSELQAMDGIERIERAFEPADLDGACVGIAATDDRDVNVAFAKACEERRVLCNVVDKPDLCEFIVPSIVNRGDVTIAISTSGAAPALAKRMRKELEQSLPPDLEAFVAFLSEARGTIRERVSEFDRRARLMAELAAPSGYEQFGKLSADECAHWVDELIDESEASLPE